MFDFRIDVFNRLITSIGKTGKFVSINVPHPDWTESRDIFKKYIQPIIAMDEPDDVLNWATSYTNGGFMDRYTMTITGENSLEVLSFTAENAQMEWLQNQNDIPFYRVETSTPEIYMDYVPTRVRKFNYLTILDFYQVDMNQEFTLKFLTKINNDTLYQIRGRILSPQVVIRDDTLSL